MAAAHPSERHPSAWLFGAGSDLVLGCGLGSIAVSALLAFWSTTVRDVVPGAVLVLAFSLPHYGATLLRVYESAADRSRYQFFAQHVTVALAVAFAVALYSPLFGSLLLTVYLTWSPWHYTGQNYGIFLMMLGRRGVRVDPVTKRWIYSSFLLSYGLAFLGTHTAVGAANYAPVVYDSTVFRLFSLGIPSSIGSPLLILCGVGYTAATVRALWLLGRLASVRDLVPCLVLCATQALWFSLPVAIRYVIPGPATGALAGIYSAYGFLWIASAHAIQYLWITTYYATSNQSPRRPLQFLAKAGFAGFAVWTLPALIFAPRLLGTVPHESGLALMVAAVVNLHHFVLDGVVWKLRDGRVARILLRSDSSPPAEKELERPTARRRWRGRLPALVFSLGAMCVVYGLFTLYEENTGFRRSLAEGDTLRARRALDRLAWLGREGPSRHIQLGRHLASLGELAPARREFERSLEIHRTFDGLASLGKLNEQEKQWSEAARAYEEALELNPDDSSILFRAGVVWLRLDRPDQAERVFERAHQLEPDRSMVRIFLERARRRLEPSPSARPGSE